MELYRDALAEATPDITTRIFLVTQTGRANLATAMGLAWGQMPLPPAIFSSGQCLCCENAAE